MHSFIVLAVSFTVSFFVMWASSLWVLLSYRRSGSLGPHLSHADADGAWVIARRLVALFIFDIVFILGGAELLGASTFNVTLLVWLGSCLAIVPVVLTVCIPLERRRRHEAAAFSPERPFNYHRPWPTNDMGRPLPTPSGPGTF